jgi:hypothetical protein
MEISQRAAVESLMIQQAPTRCMQSKAANQEK